MGGHVLVVVMDGKVGGRVLVVGGGTGGRWCGY